MPGVSRVDPELVLSAARLARLRLAPREAERLAPQFERILGAFERLQRLDLEGVSPLVTPLEREDVLRDDVPRQGLAGEALLERAPRRADGFFVVPRTVGGEP
jgi:aspartyl-tRNA(Asn)/glutamyl-tRNA(Gln) amidotransferase subunit C